MKKLLLTIGLLFGLVGVSEAGQPVSSFRESVSTHPYISGVAVTDAAAVKINTTSAFATVIVCNTSSTHKIFIANRSNVTASGSTQGIPILPDTCGGSLAPIASSADDVRDWYAIYESGGSANVTVVEYL